MCGPSKPFRADTTPTEGISVDLRPPQPRSRQQEALAKDGYRLALRRDPATHACLSMFPVHP